jgi:hypothetical protein
MAAIELQTAIVKPVKIFRILGLSRVELPDFISLVQ